MGHLPARASTIAGRRRGSRNARLVVGVLDAEVCGEEKGAEFGHKLLLRVLGASEVSVAAAIEGGGVSGRMGHLVQEYASERLIR